MPIHTIPCANTTEIVKVIIIILTLIIIILKNYTYMAHPQTEKFIDEASHAKKYKLRVTKEDMHKLKHYIT